MPWTMRRSPASSPSSPEETRAIILHGEGKHFSAGADLSAFAHISASGRVHFSRSWHRAFDCIENGGVPVVAVLQGAVIGGGLELAAAAHIRVAERSAYYALPEAARGIFVGGGVCGGCGGLLSCESASAHARTSWRGRL